MPKYQQDFRAFGEHVLKAAFMVEEMHRRAERVHRVAVDTAHVEEGTERESFHVESGMNRERAFGRVLSTDPHFLSKEFGHAVVDKDGKTVGHVEGLYTLTRALDAAHG